MNSFKIQNWVVQTFLNEKLTIRPNVELDEWNKFVFMTFSVETIQGSVKVCVSKNQCFYFGQMTHLMTSNEQNLKRKLLEIIKIKTFYIDHFSIEECLSKQYSPNFESHKLYETICDNRGFSTTPSQYFIKCKNSLYMKCSSW